MGGQRLAAQPGPATVSQLFHGVPGGCTHVGPPDQEGAARTAQNGGQLPQVELGFCVPALASFTAISHINLLSLPMFSLSFFSGDSLSVCVREWRGKYEGVKRRGECSCCCDTLPVQVCVSRPSLSYLLGQRRRIVLMLSEHR